MVETLEGELVWIWEACAEIDQNEGRGGLRLVGWYLTQSEAEESVKTEGVWGTPSHHVKQFKALKVRMLGGTFSYWKIEEVKVEDPVTEAVIRNRALAKLTNEEKKVLGL